jgi:hypothetical protein
MRHALVVLALIVAVALAACQDYQFSPVGHCLVQPGRASVGSVAAIDVLFVVDDSNSMDVVQARLASNFETFIDRIAQKQQARVAAGKEPFDIYIAVTSTSVLVNRYIETNGSCGRVSPGVCSIETVTTPPNRSAYSYDCSNAPGLCGDIVTNYYNFVENKCTPGILKANGAPYPAGAFLAAGSNPKVIGFTRNLNWSSGTADPTIQGLIAKFKQNIQVGSCGANQEMPFEAARLAIQKALAKQQGLGGGETWPHPGSELAVIFVGNEDDCSTPRADQGGLVWDGKQAGLDTCYADSRIATPQKLTKNSEYVTFLTGLGRPLVAAFVRPGFPDCNGPADMGARMHALATDLSSAGATVIEASVCGAFGDPLQQIAAELAPPDTLALPTTPAADVVTRLYLEGLDGQTDHVCDGPAAGKEWWFVDCNATPQVPLAAGRTSACVQVAQGGACAPTGGQTLIAEYLGRIPNDGCASAEDCRAALGGKLSDWACEGATSAQRGTCLCASH